MAATRPYPEMSALAVGLGTLQGILMTAAFVYIGLKLGFGLSGSAVAAIVGFGILRGGLGRRSIVENNINQTVASGINTASAGVVFTLPALMLLSVGDPTLKNFPLGALTFAAIAGSAMGTILIIPLRKQMIEFERLKFPSGVAVASLLRSPGEGMAQGLLLTAGTLVSMVFTGGIIFQVLPEDLDLGRSLGVPPWFPLAVSLSCANFGAGLLSGRGGLPFAFGGILAYWWLSPFAVTVGWVPPDPALPAADVAVWQAGEVYGQMLRPLGIGMLIGGALAGVVEALPAVTGALKSLQVAARLARERGTSADEIDPKLLYGGIAASFVLLFIAAWMAGDQMTLWRALLVAVVGSAWLGLAGIIVATATGHTDISPLSGLALIAVTLMFFLTGGDVTASILIGMTVCIATNQCADMMTDLKTGHLIGAVPREQQLSQIITCWIGPLVAIGVLAMLWNMPVDGSPGFGPDSTACIQKTAECLPAPQAGALQGMIAALRSSDAAVDKYVGGAVLGGALSLFPIGGIAVLVGLAMYLPFSVTLSYGIGNLVAMGVERWGGTGAVSRKLIPFAAGLIVGEALTQLVNSLFRMAGGGS